MSICPRPETCARPQTLFSGTNFASGGGSDRGQLQHFSGYGYFAPNSRRASRLPEKVKPDPTWTRQPEAHVGLPSAQWRRKSATEMRRNSSLARAVKSSDKTKVALLPIGAAR